MNDEPVTVKLTDDLMLVAAAATALGRTRMTIYRWVTSRKMIGVKIGDILFIPKSEVERLKNKEAVSV